MHWTTLAYDFFLHDVLGHAVGALVASGVAWGARLAGCRHARRRNPDSTNRP